MQNDEMIRSLQLQHSSVQIAELESLYPKSFLSCSFRDKLTGRKARQNQMYLFNRKTHPLIDLVCARFTEIRLSLYV